MRDLSGPAPGRRAAPAAARRRRRLPRRARPGRRVAAADGRALGVSVNALVHHFGSQGGDGRRRAAPGDRGPEGRAGAAGCAASPTCRWPTCCGGGGGGSTPRRRTWRSSASASRRPRSTPPSSGLPGDVRADQIGVWRANIEQRLVAEGVAPAVARASRRRSSRRCSPASSSTCSPPANAAASPERWTPRSPPSTSECSTPSECQGFGVRTPSTPMDSNTRMDVVLDGLRGERCRADDQVGGLLRQHHHRGVDVAVGDVRHRPRRRRPGCRAGRARASCRGRRPTSSSTPIRHVHDGCSAVSASRATQARISSSVSTAGPGDSSPPSNGANAGWARMRRAWRIASTHSRRSCVGRQVVEAQRRLDPRRRAT